MSEEGLLSRESWNFADGVGAVARRKTKELGKERRSYQDALPLLFRSNYDEREVNLTRS